MAKWLVLALILIAPLASSAFAQGTSKAPSTDAVQDANLQQTIDLVKDNLPTGKSAPSPDQSKDNSPSGRPASTLDQFAQDRWILKLKWIVPGILIATPLILAIVLVAMRMAGVKSPEHIMLAAALVLVVEATLTVSLTAEGSDSLSASMGILGAIAGYLFGRARQEPQQPQQPVEPAVRREPPTIENVVDRRAA
jgi:hypothetical protein